MTIKSFSDFKEKTVLITGGASGIGNALCRALAQYGARVYAADVNQKGLGDLVESESSITAVHLDVGRCEDFQQAVDQIVTEHGRLDMIINNAGIALAGDFNETSMAEIEKIMRINLWGVIHGTKLAYAQMVRQGHGTIVNVSSSGGAMPVPKQAMYSSIKHAVLGLSHSLREEAETYGITVCTVLPGMVKSDLWDTAINVNDYNMKQEMESTGLDPIGADDAARAILTGITRNQRSIIFPGINRLVLRLYRWFPELMTRLALKPLVQAKD